MNPKPALLVALGIVSMAVLAGCSATPDVSTPTPTAPMPDSQVITPTDKATGACEQGRSEVTQSNHEVTLDAACPDVVVSANNAIVHLGDVKTLTVTGGLTRVVVDSVETVVIEGNGNDVLWSGEKPLNVDDRGDQNFVKKQSSTKG